jgi:hypothetical protein
MTILLVDTGNLRLNVFKSWASAEITIVDAQTGM